MGQGLSLPVVGAIAAGAAAAVASDIVTSRAAPRQRLPLLAAGLAGAALIYPAFRRRGHAGAALVREGLGVLVFSSMAAACTRAGSPSRAGRLLAGAWLSHAAFDYVHKAGPGSRLPSWYAPMCAGYDAVIAARLVLRPVPASQ